jgi:Fungal specific transcription factor domain
LRARVEELEKLVDRSITANTANKAWSTSPALSPIPEIHGPVRSNVSSSLFFLDERYFTHLHCNVQPVLLSVPNDIANVLKDEYDQPRGLEQLLSRYFDTVHGWMPMISKMRMKRVLDRSVGGIQADTAFLLACMKLLLHTPERGSLPEESSLYRIVKAASLQLEIAGLQSLMVIQGGILIAVYELGHGIYPAAYTTVAQFARQAISLGLHNREAPQFLQPWPEWEEEIRVWWLVVMLDRYAKTSPERKELINSGMLP